MVMETIYPLDSNRLMHVPLEIRQHPFWKGSMEHQSFLNGGITIGYAQSRVEARKKCPDLTFLEKSWNRLWQQALERNGVS